MVPRPFLRGERVDLRPLSPSDVTETYVGWLNDADVCRFNSHHVYPYTLELARQYVDRVLSSRTEIVLAMIAKQDGRHIGNIALQSIHQLYRSAEYAVVVGEKDFWGKGLVTEASVLLIRHGFDALDLNRIHCGTAADNVPMQRLAERLGFVAEGRRREAMFKHGAYVDILEYGLLRREFKGD